MPAASSVTVAPVRRRIGDLRGWDGAGIVGFAALALLVVVLVVSGTRSVDVDNGDSNSLVAGARVGVECVADGVWRDCGGTGVGSHVGSFALLQYLPAAALVAFGMDDADVVRALAWLSTAAFVVLLWMFAAPARRLLSPPWSTVLLIVAVSGPLLLYALIPYAEMLGATLGVAFLLACRQRSLRLIAVLGPFTMMGKETAVPFLVVTAWVCARGSDDRWLPPRRIVVAIAATAVAAVAAQALFNQFRFATFTNEANNVPWSRVPGVDLRARLAWALWGAPNVGIAWFWPAVAFVLAGLAVAWIVQLRRQPMTRRSPGWLPSATVLGLALAMTVGLASWYSTFGWLAWGPRLSLQLLPVLAVAAIVAGGEELTAGLHWLVRTPVALAAATVVIAALAVPQAGVIWNQDAILLPTVPTPECPELLPVEVAEPDYFYGCGLASAWSDDPYFLVEASGGSNAAKAIAQLSVVIAIGALGLRLRRQVLSGSSR